MVVRALEVDRRTLDDIQQDPLYSDRAKRIAAYLDGRCRSVDKWAAWPKVSTIAADLGWDDSEYGGRKRVERGIKELIDGGDLARMTLGELVQWHDAEGDALGLPWPKQLPRGLRLNLRVCVLNWRIRAPGTNLPILPECDTAVATNCLPESPSTQPTVALNATPVSYSPATEVSQSILLNVRSLNVESEAITSDVVALASEEEGSPTKKSEPIATVKASPAVASLWSPREQAERLFCRLRDRGLILKLELDPERGEVIRPYRQAEYVEVIRDDEAAELRRLRDHVIAFLKGEPAPKSGGTPLAIEGSPVPAPAPVPSASKVPLAPKVAPTKQARVMGMIGALQTAGGPSDVVVARAIGDAIGDTKPESIETYTGYARAVRTGKLSLDALIVAFEAACGKGKTNRGATLTRRIQRWKEAHPTWNQNLGCSRADQPS